MQPLFRRIQTQKPKGIPYIWLAYRKNIFASMLVILDDWKKASSKSADGKHRVLYLQAGQSHGSQL